MKQGILEFPKCGVFACRKQSKKLFLQILLHFVLAGWRGGGGVGVEVGVGVNWSSLI